MSKAIVVDLILDHLRKSSLDHIESLVLDGADTLLLNDERMFSKELLALASKMYASGIHDDTQDERRTYEENNNLFLDLLRAQIAEMSQENWQIYKDALIRVYCTHPDGFTTSRAHIVSNILQTYARFLSSQDDYLGYRLDQLQCLINRIVSIIIDLTDNDVKRILDDTLDQGMYCLYELNIIIEYEVMGDYFDDADQEIISLIFHS